MSTIRQLIKRYKRVRKVRKSSVPALGGCPHKLGTVKNILIEKPKKPNSARRSIFRIVLKNKRIIRAHIPGIYKIKAQKKLNKFGVALVRGGRTQDLIGIRYKLVLNKFDVPGI